MKYSDISNKVTYLAPVLVAKIILKLVKDF